MAKKIDQNGDLKSNECQTDKLISKVQFRVNRCEEIIYFGQKVCIKLKALLWKFGTRTKKFARLSQIAHLLLMHAQKPLFFSFVQQIDLKTCFHVRHLRLHPSSHPLTLKLTLKK